MLRLPMFDLEASGDTIYPKYAKVKPMIFVLQTGLVYRKQGFLTIAIEAVILNANVENTSKVVIKVS